MRTPVALAVFVALATSCESPDVPDRERWGGTPCRLAGLDRPAQCGTVERPLDPAAPGGATIAIHVARIPASKAARRNPLYFFAGGPGQGAIAAFAPLLSALDELGRDRDIVLVDQRGTGDSSPLACSSDPDAPLSERMSPEVDVPLLRRCLAGYQVDPRFFTTEIAVEDLDAVREALGDARIDVIGGSYGTRAALVYTRAHPDRVGHMVLDGVAPVDMAMPSSFGVDGQAALSRVFADCAADPDCGPRFPDLARRFDAYLDELARQPRSMTLEDPRTGAVETVVVQRDAIAHAVRGLLYVPQLQALLPLTLDRAVAGDLGPLLAQGSALGGGMSETMSQGMFLSVVCAEDVPFAAVPADPSFLGGAFVRLLQDSCAQWPRANIDPHYRDPIVLETPTLLLSGALDPVTPPRWAEHALEGLPNGRHVVFPAAGHGNLTSACARELIHGFLDDAESLADDCVAESARPPFFLDLAGPPT